MWDPRLVWAIARTNLRAGLIGSASKDRITEAQNYIIFRKEKKVPCLSHIHSHRITAIFWDPNLIIYVRLCNKKRI